MVEYTGQTSFEMIKRFRALLTDITNPNLEVSHTYALFSAIILNVYAEADKNTGKFKKFEEKLSKSDCKIFYKKSKFIGERDIDNNAMIWLRDTRNAVAHCEKGRVKPKNENNEIVGFYFELRRYKKVNFEEMELNRDGLIEVAKLVADVYLASARDFGWAAS